MTNKTQQATNNLVSWSEFYTEMNRLTNHYVINLYVASLGNSVANTTIQHEVGVPEAGTIVSVKTRCTTSTGTTKPTVDIFNEDAGTPATIGAPVTLTAAKTVYTFTPTTTAVTAGQGLGLRCTTAADGTATHVTVAILIKRTAGITN